MRNGSKTAIAAVAACATCAWSTVVRADDAQVLSARHHTYESPQHFELEIRVMSYLPNVDDEPALRGATPFATTFGSDSRIALGAEFDWQVLRIPWVGTIGPGAAIQYTTMSAKAPLANQVPNQPTQLSAEDTSLTIYPMYAVAVLRVDVAMREARIPIVPYAKAGLGYALWAASNSLGTSVSNRGVVGKGHTAGTQLALGAQLQLNAFDRYAAQQLDETTGINNTYLFAEYMMANLNGLGQTNALYVGTNTFAFGLAFEF